MLYGLIDIEIYRHTDTCTCRHTPDIQTHRDAHTNTGACMWMCMHTHMESEGEKGGWERHIDTCFLRHTDTYTHISRHTDLDIYKCIDTFIPRHTDMCTHKRRHMAHLYAHSPRCKHISIYHIHLYLHFSRWIPEPCKQSFLPKPGPDDSGLESF